MSLILEALKKSEANRRLGEAPDLATPFATRPRRRSPLPLLFVLIVLASAGGWWLLRTPPALDKDAGAGRVDGAAQSAAGVRTPTPGTPPATPAGKARTAQTPAGAATTAPAPEQPLAGGFIALPKPWAPAKPGAGKPAAPSNAAPINATAAAAARRPDPAAVNSMATPQTQAQAANAAAVAPANAARTAAPSVVATGAGQRKPDAVVAATPATSGNIATPAVVASGSGQQKSEPEPAAASNARTPGASSFVASGAGQKKAEPAAATAAPAPAMVASGSGQKKPEPPAATAPANAVVASGQGQQKPDHHPADARIAAAAAAMPPLSAPPYNELPFATRKDLPALKLSMHVFAVEPQQRFVILNNSRLGEGDKQEDLSVREIRPDGVVLEFRGQRFFYPRDGF